METVFVLISCEAETTDKVIKKIQMIDGVKEITPVFGLLMLLSKLLHQRLGIKGYNKTED